MTSYSTADLGLNMGSKQSAQGYLLLKKTGTICMKETEHSFNLAPPVKILITESLGEIYAISRIIQQISSLSFHGINGTGHFLGAFFDLVCFGCNIFSLNISSILFPNISL